MCSCTGTYTCTSSSSSSIYGSGSSSDGPGYSHITRDTKDRCTSADLHAEHAAARQHATQH
eukprot:COSAG06_NODE_45091_length_357_cov_2.624031_1_plen_60_part_10